MVIPIIISALGMVFKGFRKINGGIGNQKKNQYHPEDSIATILKRVLETCCHLVSSEGQSAHASVKHSLVAKIIILLIIVKIENIQLRRKTTVWILQETNRWDCAWENLDMDKKKKPKERNGIYFNSRTKQCHRDLLYPSINWPYTTD